MALFRKKESRIPYDPATQEPAVRRSICTGEMTAGFMDRETGKFHELMKIERVEDFARQVGTEEIRVIY